MVLVYVALDMYARDYRILCKVWGSGLGFIMHGFRFRVALWDLYGLNGSRRLQNWH